MNLTVLNNKSAKDLFAISVSTFLNQIIGLVRGFFVAKYLGPADFGILKATQLIIMLEKFGSLGFRTTATRETAHFNGIGDLDKANKARNVAYSGELLLTILLFLIGVCSSLFFHSTIVVIAILLASGQLFTSKILGIFNTDAIIEKKIILHSKILFGSGLLSALLIIITVPFWKIYTVLGIPILAAIVSCYVYYKAIGAKLRFDIDKTELMRLLRIGLPLTLSTLAYGSYKYSERILVGTFLGIQALGFYSLAMMPMDYMTTLLLLSIKIRKIHVYELLGQKKYHETHKIVIRETAILLILALISIPILWFAVDLVITYLLNSYTEAILVSKILVTALPLRVIGSYVNAVLLSSVVNKQVLFAPLHLTAVSIFVLSVLILRHLDLASLVNIAIADVAGYAIVHLGSIVFYKKYFMDAYLKDSNYAKDIVQ